MPTDLCERFARTVAAQEAAALEELLEPDVNFRALTPGRCWEGDDASAVVEVILGTWFSPECSITGILGVERATVGALDRVGYRFQLKVAGDDFIVEQQAYLKTESDTKISRLRILCSGFIHDK